MLIVKERRKQYWQMRRVDERQKRKEKKRKRKELGGINELTLKALEVDPQRQLIKKLRKRTEEEIDYKGTIVLDCSFDSLMTDKEIASLGNQLTFR